MNHSAIANAIRAQVASSVATGLSLAVQYDNQAYAPAQGITWARASIRFGDTMQTSLGSPSSQSERTVGVLMVQLFGPVDKGDGDLLEKADAIRGIFKRTTIGGVVFNTPSVANIGKTDDTWWQVNVNCPFFADNIG